VTYGHRLDGVLGYSSGSSQVGGGDARLSSWLPVITLIVGSVLTLLGGLITEGLREKRAERKDREEHERTERKDREAREYARALERDAFQRQALPALQDALHELFERTTRYWVEHKTADAWESNPSERADYARINSRVELLRNRIADADVRRLATACQDHGLALFAASSGDVAETHWDDFQESYIEAMKQSGEILRELG
jgi:hypothetical protein